MQARHTAPCAVPAHRQKLFRLQEEVQQCKHEFMDRMAWLLLTKEVQQGLGIHHQLKVAVVIAHDLGLE